MTLASNDSLQSMRVDLVGSLLRPQSVKDAFAKYGEGSISEADLKRAQDDAIRDVVAKQVAHNLPIIVDGEFRRTSFMESFAVVAGVEEWQAGVKTYHEILKRPDDSESITHKGQDPILLNRKRVAATWASMAPGIRPMSIPTLWRRCAREARTHKRFWSVRSMLTTK